MKILATSDTHFPFDSKEWPDADVFIHAGDFLTRGDVKEWAGVLPSFSRAEAALKLVVPGNHDRYVEVNPTLAKAEMQMHGCDLILPDNPIRVLLNEMTMLGISWVPNLPDWAFNRGEEWIYDWLKSIEVEPDIVVSHSPPKYVLDKLVENGEEVYVGSVALRNWWRELKRKPLMWIFGHIHEGYGTQKDDGTMFYNVAHCDGRYKQSNLPRVIEL